jgi:hypothetical protein
LGPVTTSESKLKHLVPRLQEALVEHLGHDGGKRILSLAVERVLSRPYSMVIIWRLKTQDDLERIVSKTVVHHPENLAITDRANQAIVEYEILLALSRRFQQVEKCSVPRPLAIIPELETYIMEFVDAGNLADDLRYARYLAAREGFDCLAEHYYHCGCWLRHFQEFTGIRRAGPEVLDAAVDRCADRLRLIEQAGDRHWPAGLGERIMTFLHEQQACLSGEEVLVTGRHGDFGPWNILVGSNGITVVDFLGYREDTIAIDLLSMLVLLENECHCLTSSGKRLAAVRDRFLEGFGPVPPVQRPVLLICESLHRICTVWGCISQGRDDIRRRIERGRSLQHNRDWLSQLGKRKLLWPAD